MGLFGWLFGRRHGRASGQEWEVSERGNPTLIIDDLRITVFPQDRGWKYCIAEVDDSKEPYFSDAYATELAARETALAQVKGASSSHQPLSVDLAVVHRHKWEEIIAERENLIEELRSYHSNEPDAGLTDLRKRDAKVASLINHLTWQLALYHRDKVSARLIAVAEQQQANLTNLGVLFKARIVAKETQRKPRAARVTESALSDELAAKVDDLIRLLADTGVMTRDERARRAEEFQKNAVERMIGEGVTYGRATGGQEWLNQDPEAFREFMMKADQDLAWQCQTVMSTFMHFKQSGEIPAPHYPMRVAVLLSKAKDFDREKQFLAAWCRHFTFGNGATYSALVERAKKAGAIA